MGCTQMNIGKRPDSAKGASFSYPTYGLTAVNSMMGQTYLL